MFTPHLSPYTYLYKSLRSSRRCWLRALPSSIDKWHWRCYVYFKLSLVWLVRLLCFTATVPIYRYFRMNFTLLFKRTSVTRVNSLKLAIINTRVFAEILLIFVFNYLIWMVLSMKNSMTTTGNINGNNTTQHNTTDTTTKLAIVRYLLMAKQWCV